ncbi:1-phosphofructokinase [Micromonospora pattaloongensis]|uniref:1-phosphofructokinase n=2 Tax=Micromonospora pattaloongensis TaxID=405436 RepID=A0A1H3RS26_9ACTN|nr:1-phosphofructokinase [Micromonospora pattaloongensis]
MVFAPLPQLTLTIEQGSDSPDLHLHPGGQGIWQARMINSLGVPVTLCAVLGGETGTVLEQLITAEGIELRMVGRQATSGWYIHDRRDGSRQAFAESPGTPLSRHELDELYGMALAEGFRAAVSILSGPADPSVVAPEVYRRLACDLTSNGGRVVADLSGDHLSAVLDGGVCFLKVSHEELLRDGRAAGDSVDEFVAALHRLHDEGAETVLISRAGDPALALLEGDVFEVEVPRLQTADPRGAGDSMTAGVSAVLARGGELDEAIRTGAAAGALNVTRHGLGTGRAQAIREVIKRVRLNPLGKATKSP